MLEIIDEIIALEWEAFQNVNNEGGRADCQNDYHTFFINRKSQFLTWNREACASYLRDLCTAKENGRNLLMEKYARMMVWTSPLEHRELEAFLPPLTQKAAALADETAAVLIAWQQDFAKAYPRLAARARPVRSGDDATGYTSFETYLRGELLSYSPQTLNLYADHVKDLRERGMNMSFLLMEHLVRLNGYESLAQAEEQA